MGQRSVSGRELRKNGVGFKKRDKKKPIPSLDCLIGLATEERKL